MKTYTIEREGQIDFFNNYGIPYEEDNSILINNTDGVYNGNILEFKLTINNLNKVLFQTIKYLSRMRIKGESIPANILLIDLNNEKAYQYKTIDYINDIQKVYIGAASKENQGFKANNPNNIFDYSNIIDSNNLKKILKNKKSIEEMYIPIDIDENCIVGWAERYYSELPKASKGDFLGDETGANIKLKGEIRDPKHFKGLINAYTGKSNEKFKYLMDCLNDKLSKKDLGAFYTPIPYCKKAAELVKIAVDRIPDNNDYIILDRCAGTGNLESALIGLYDKNGDELINHCIVSTYEYYEYKVLNERLGDKVRDIIPPTEADVIYENGKVSNADALSKDFIENPIIKKYIDNPKCSIILFENPPYRDAGATDTKTTKGFNNYIKTEMLKEKLNNKTVAYDLANLFIWSGYKYYLRQSTDSYILFSPIKYWKTHGLSQKKYIKGYIFNRNHFHATPSAIPCILWSNENDNINEIRLPALDIINNEIILTKEEIILKKAYKMSNKFFPKTNLFSGKKGIICGLDGVETTKKPRGIPLYNPDYFAYLRLNSFNLDPINRTLTTVMSYPAMGRYLTKDNYLNLLPLFVAKLYQEEKWYQSDIYVTSADGGNKYTKDNNFIKSCLIYTCLSNQNKCLSFKGSDGNLYQNQLCFDKDTISSITIKKYTLNKKDKELINLYNKILKEAKKTSNYNKLYKYGIYQIEKELNTFTEIEKGNNKEKIYDYPILNGDLNTLKTLLKEYYKNYIVNKMFKYELLK